MAKVVLNDITNVATSLNDLNYNFTAIENAFADHLSRKPAATNHLETSLDLNSNNIYNVKYLQAEDLRVNGQSFTDNMSTVNSLISTSELIRNETTIIAAQAAASAVEAADIVVELGDQVAQASASANLAYGYKVEAANSFAIAQEQAVAAMGSANTASAAALSASVDAAQTALDVIDTTADALQTGIDASAASVSAAAALVSENNAAQSAADAAASAGALTPVEDQILASAAKTTPVDTDEFGIVDTTVLKRLSWANVKATLLTYFNTVYATLAALNLKAPIASPTFTGTVGGITKTMVGLGNVDNTSDVNKPVSTATQTALNLKSDTTHVHAASTVTNTPAGNIAATTVQAALNELDSEKAALAGSASQSFSMLNGTVAGTLSAGAVSATSTSGGTTATQLTLINASVAVGTSTKLVFSSYTGGLPTGWITNTNTDGGGNYSLKFGTYNVDNGMTITGAAVTIPGTLSLTGAASTLGYGTGAGGTVTQATSKSTTVTLNKPCGQITMHNETLAANTSVYFLVSNSLVSLTDTVIVNIKAGAASGLSYAVGVVAVVSGGFYIAVRNHTAGSLSEGLILNFAILKGVAS